MVQFTNSYTQFHLLLVTNTRKTEFRYKQTVSKIYWSLGININWYQNSLKKHCFNDSSFCTSAKHSTGGFPWWLTRYAAFISQQVLNFFINLYFVCWYMSLFSHTKGYIKQLWCKNPISDHIRKKKSILENLTLIINYLLSKENYSFFLLQW